MEVHSEGRPRKSILSKKRHFKACVCVRVGGGGGGLIWFKFFQIKNWKVLAYQYQTWCCSDSTNAIIKHMPITVASPADKDYYRN